MKNRADGANNERLSMGFQSGTFAYKMLELNATEAQSITPKLNEVQ